MISFQFKGKRRTQLFLKYPAGTPPPEGEWECCCGHANTFNGTAQVYCGKCGTRLKINENHDERQKMMTLVRVGHAELNGNGGNGGHAPQA